MPRCRDHSQGADLASRRKPFKGNIPGDQFVYLARARTVSLPEPVDGDWVNWRPAVEWEMELVRSARLRERRAELALFDGLIA